MSAFFLNRKKLPWADSNNTTPASRQAFLNSFKSEFMWKNAMCEWADLGYSQHQFLWPRGQFFQLLPWQELLLTLSLICWFTHCTCYKSKVQAAHIECSLHLLNTRWQAADDALKPIQIFLTQWSSSPCGNGAWVPISIDRRKNWGQWRDDST